MLNENNDYLFYFNMKYSTKQKNSKYAIQFSKGEALKASYILPDNYRKSQTKTTIQKLRGGRKSN